MSQEQVAEILKLHGMSMEELTNAADHITTKKWDCTHAALLNLPLIVLSHEPIKTSYGDARLALCIVEGEERQVLMGGTVLVQQLLEIGDQLPIKAVIRKVGKYYSFV